MAPSRNKGDGRADTHACVLVSLFVLGLTALPPLEVNGTNPAVTACGLRLVTGDAAHETSNHMRTHSTCAARISGSRAVFEVPNLPLALPFAQASILSGSDKTACFEAQSCERWCSATFMILGLVASVTNRSKSLLVDCAKSKFDLSQLTVSHGEI